MRAAIQERRRSSRAEGPAGVDINLVHPARAIPADNVNFSDGGLCVRLAEMLEVRSLVRLQVTPERSPVGRARPVECTGRVAWVIQRLDLRDAPPFLFDIGIEFVDPPALLRQLLARRGGRVAALDGPAALRRKGMEPAVIRGRTYVPRLDSETHQPLRWHLIVTVEGMPCFSGRYASERAALADWARFKRQQARSPRRVG